jgi:hypothetical protein
MRLNLTSPSKVVDSKKLWQVSWLTAVISLAFPYQLLRNSGLRFLKCRIQLRGSSRFKRDSLLIPTCLSGNQSFTFIKERRRKLSHRRCECKKKVVTKLERWNYFLEYLPINCTCATMCPSIAFRRSVFVEPEESFSIVSKA